MAEPTRREPDNSDPGSSGTTGPSRRRQPGQSWESLVEEQIRDAQERGEFSNLRGRGKSLAVTGNANDPNWMANAVLKNAGFVPPAIDLGNEIDAARAASQVPLDRLRRRREYLLSNPKADATDYARFNAAREKAIVAHREALKAINDRVLALSLAAPPALHRRPIAVDREVEAFAQECPPL